MGIDDKIETALRKIAPKDKGVAEVAIAMLGQPKKYNKMSEEGISTDFSNRVKNSQKYASQGA